MTADMPPSYKLLRPVCVICGKKSSGLLMMKGCTVEDHGDDGGGCCNDEQLWPCSMECAREITVRRGALLTMDVL